MGLWPNGVDANVSKTINNSITRRQLLHSEFMHTPIECVLTVKWIIYENSIIKSFGYARG